MDTQKTKPAPKEKILKKLLKKLVSSETPGRILPAPDKIPGKRATDQH